MYAAAIAGVELSLAHSIVASTMKNIGTSDAIGVEDAESRVDAHLSFQQKRRCSFELPCSYKPD